MSNPEIPLDHIYDQLSCVGWRVLELDKDYPHIAPGSAVGQIAVGLAMDFMSADKQLDMQREEAAANLSADGDRAFADCVQAHYSALQRQETFERVYDAIYKEFLYEPAQTPNILDEAVTFACENDARYLENRRLSPGLRHELVQLVEELGVFYRLEADKHFQAWQQPLST